MPWKLNQHHWHLLHKAPIWWSQYQALVDELMTQDGAERHAFQTITERMDQHERKMSALHERESRATTGTAQSGTDVEARMHGMQDESEQPAD